MRFMAILSAISTADTKDRGLTSHSEHTAREAEGREQAKPGGRSRCWRVLIIAPILLLSGLFAAGCGSSPSPSSEAESLVARGLQAESAGHFQAASNDFGSAAVKDNADAMPDYQLGLLYQRLHEPEQAATAYKQALSIAPKFRNAMFNLAVVDTPTQPQAALNLYNELHLQRPKDARVDFNLGLLLIAQLQPTPGHQFLKKAIALDPTLAKQLPAGITP